MKDPLTDLGRDSRIDQAQIDAGKARSRRNWVLALSLVAFVILVFVVTIVRLRGNAGPHF
jgi:hypothetical protein